MAAAETARLIASLELQDKNFTRGIRNVERGVGRVDKKLSAFGGFVNRNLARGIDRAAASLVDGVFAGVESLKELEQQQAQTNAVIKSTGGIAGVSGDEVTKLAEKYEGLNAIIGDEIIRSGENMLLTFTNIHKDAFEPTLEAVLDMNTALGKGPEGLTSTALQVGKALNDPTKGLTKLQRAGVNFTKGQVKQIKALQKSGDLLGAQKIILKELNKEFGGSFAAQGDTTAGKVAKFNDAVEDLQRTFAKALLPIISKVADKLGTFLGDPAVVAAIEDAGVALGEAFDGILAAAEKINWGAIAGGLKSAAGFAGELVGWFGKFPDWAQALIVGGFVATKLPIVGDIFSEAAKGLIKGVLGINAGIVNVNGPVAGGPLGGGGKGGGPLFGKGGLGKLLVGFTGVGLVAALASEFEDEVQGLANDLGNGWRSWLKTSFHIDVPTLKIPELEDLQWPFGPKNTPTILPELVGGNGILGGTPAGPTRGGGDRPSPGNPGLTRAIIELKKAFATGQRPHGPPPKAPPETTAKQQATINAVKNAQSIASRENSAQKTELANIKNASATLNTTTNTGLRAVGTGISTATTAAAFHSAANVIATGSTTTATRAVAPPIVGALAVGFASLAATIWAARPPAPIIQSTTVVQQYTTRQRTGATSGSRNSYVRAPGAG